MKNLILILCVVCTSNSVLSQSDEVCKFVAEISLVSVERGAFLVCTQSANPAACSIALSAHACGQNPACEGVVKHFVEEGCTYTVEVVDDKIKIYGEAAKSKMFDLKRTFDELNTVEGIVWIQRVLTGGY